MEEADGLEKAIRLDEVAMSGWTAIEARRVAERLGLRPDGGLDALERALRARLYTLLNRQEIRREAGRLVFTVKTCRVQDARRRRGLPPFACRSVGLVEYAEFAKVIDQRLRVGCLHCPPGDLPAGEWCSWEFTFG